MKRLWTRQIPKLLYDRSKKSVLVMLGPRTLLCDISHELSPSLHRASTMKVMKVIY